MRLTGLVVAGLLAQASPSLVRVTCQTDCSVKVAGQRGRRVAVGVSSPRPEATSPAPGGGNGG